MCIVPYHPTVYSLTLTQHGFTFRLSHKLLKPSEEPSKSSALSLKFQKPGEEDNRRWVHNIGWYCVRGRTLVYICVFGMLLFDLCIY